MTGSRKVTVSTDVHGHTAGWAETPAAPATPRDASVTSKPFSVRTRRYQYQTTSHSPVSVLRSSTGYGKRFSSALRVWSKRLAKVGVHHRPS